MLTVESRMFRILFVVRSVTPVMLRALRPSRLRTAVRPKFKPNCLPRKLTMPPMTLGVVRINVMTRAVNSRLKVTKKTVAIKLRVRNMSTAFRLCPTLNSARSWAMTGLTVRLNSYVRSNRNRKPFRDAYV